MYTLSCTVYWFMFVFIFVGSPIVWGCIFRVLLLDLTIGSIRKTHNPVFAPICKSPKYYTSSWIRGSQEAWIADRSVHLQTVPNGSQCSSAKTEVFPKGLDAASYFTYLLWFQWPPHTTEQPHSYVTASEISWKSSIMTPDPFTLRLLGKHRGTIKSHIFGTCNISTYRSGNNKRINKLDSRQSNHHSPTKNLQLRLSRRTINLQLKHII